MCSPVPPLVNSVVWIYWIVPFLFDRESCLQDPTIIHFLFEVSQTLHDGVDLSNIRNDEHQHSPQLVSRFVNIVGSFSILYFCCHRFSKVNHTWTFWFFPVYNFNFAGWIWERLWVQFIILSWLSSSFWGHEPTQGCISLW